MLCTEGYVIIIFIVPGALGLFKSWKNATKQGGVIRGIAKERSLVEQGECRDWFRVDGAIGWN
jgi:hypothetical protein